MLRLDRDRRESVPNRTSSGGRRAGDCCVSGCWCWRAGCWGDDTPAQPAVDDDQSYVGQTREYWIVAEDVLWDYAPSFPINPITGEPFDDAANVFVQPGPDRIGHRYLKALYREYTSQLPAAEESSGQPGNAGTGGHAPPWATRS